MWAVEYERAFRARYKPLERRASPARWVRACQSMALFSCNDFGIESEDGLDQFTIQPTASPQQALPNQYARLVDAAPTFNERWKAKDHNRSSSICKHDSWNSSENKVVIALPPLTDMSNLRVLELKPLSHARRSCHVICCTVI